MTQNVKSFSPSPNLTDFTDYIVKKCIDNDHFNFAIFPLFMEFLLPFKNAVECKSKLAIPFDFKTDFKDYTIYFKSLFIYYKLLNKRHDAQFETFKLFNKLIALSKSDFDASTTEGKTSGADVMEEKKETIIHDIVDKYKQIATYDMDIISAMDDFVLAQSSFTCNDLSSFINGIVAPGTAMPPGVLIDNTNDSIPTFIKKCVTNMNQDDFSIEVSSLNDDTPDLIFKKFVLFLCESYSNTESFNNAKFWVFNQLFIRL